MLQTTEAAIPQLRYRRLRAMTSHTRKPQAMNLARNRNMNQAMRHTTPEGADQATNCAGSLYGNPNDSATAR